MAIRILWRALNRTTRPEAVLDLITPWQSNAKGHLVSVSGDWERWAGTPWTPELAQQWLDWIDRRDIDRFLTAWTDTHRHALPVVAGCRARWPTGLEVICHVGGLPKLAGRRFYGLAGVTRFTVMS